MGQKVQGSSFSSTAKDAPEPDKLRSLLCSAASSHAPEFPAATQQARAREAPELATLQQQASSGACCVAAASKQASFGAGDPPELVALQ